MTKYNHAFIDAQNLYKNTKANRWAVDLRKFRRYLWEKYKVKKAYYFLGFHLEENQRVYDNIRKAGFTLVFRKHSPELASSKKGNVDTDIVFTVMSALLDDCTMDRVVLVSGDGDYYKMVHYLIKKKRFLKLLPPNRHSTSSLYYDVGKHYIDYLNLAETKEKIAYKKS